ncbi:hypothetical protein [Sphingomonas sp.]|uniref:hypothetical protein n=1 Tax=Sphingomonas sp. TaxID=28214 RepID=UPI003AFFE7A3
MLDARFGHARPEGTVSLPMIDPPRTRVRVRRHQRRLVLVARVQQMARAGLDHAAQLEPIEQPADAVDLASSLVRERVEMIVIQRQRDAVRLRVGDQQGVVQPVVRRAVGASGEAQVHECASDQAT